MLYVAAAYSCCKQRRYLVAACAKTLLNHERQSARKHFSLECHFALKLRQSGSYIVIHLISCRSAVCRADKDRWLCLH
jgi:hypothetical protein